MLSPNARIPAYILLLAVIIAAILGYYLPDRRPQNMSLQSPRSYIETVEQKRAERLQKEADDAGPPAGGR